MNTYKTKEELLAQKGVGFFCFVLVVVAMEFESFNS